MNLQRIQITSFLLFFILFSIDAIVLVSSLKFAIFLRSNFFSEIFPVYEVQEIQKYIWMIIIALSTFLYEKIYFTRHDFWGDAKRIIKGLFLSFLIVFTVLTLTKMSAEFSRTLIVLFFALALFFVPFVKRTAKKLLFSIGFFKMKVYVLAKEEKFQILQRELEENWYFGFQNASKNYDMIIIASKSFTTEELQYIINEHAQNTKDIYVIPYMDHLDFSHATIINYSNIRFSAIHIENKLLNIKNILIKYFFEKVIIVLIFPFALLFHLLMLILIKMDSPGDIIFKQKRLGKDSRHFSCYKYRTMFEDNKGILDEYLYENPDEIDHYKTYHKYKNDPRITKLGKFLRASSMDEFPQFYNILRGDMNLIGPRPYMVSEKEKLDQFDEDSILEVKPGITGLWQVSGRNELTFKQRVELDTWYIQNWSLWMDLVIFLKTIKVVLSKVGAR